MKLRGTRFTSCIVLRNSPAVPAFRPTFRPTTKSRPTAACSAIPLWLLFLPWNGCDAGGFYATGVVGEPGEACQEVYQPAAQAEARFKLAQAAAQAMQQQKVVGTDPDIFIAGLEPLKSSTTDDDADTNNADVSPTSSPETPTATEQPQEDQGLSPEAREFLKDELLDEQRQRTKELVDAAWQSLE